MGLKSSLCNWVYSSLDLWRGKFSAFNHNVNPVPENLPVSTLSLTRDPLSDTGSPMREWKLHSWERKAAHRAREAGQMEGEGRGGLGRVNCRWEANLSDPPEDYGMTTVQGPCLILGAGVVSEDGRGVLLWLQFFSCCKSDFSGATLIYSHWNYGCLPSISEARS